MKKSNYSPELHFDGNALFCGRVPLIRFLGDSNDGYRLDYVSFEEHFSEEVYSDVPDIRCLFRPRKNKFYDMLTQAYQAILSQFAIFPDRSLSQLNPLFVWRETDSGNSEISCGDLILAEVTGVEGMGFSLKWYEFGSLLKHEFGNGIALNTKTEDSACDMIEAAYQKILNQMKFTRKK